MSKLKTTIIIGKSTRENLKHVGRKDQTYDQLISELIQYKTGTLRNNHNQNDSLNDGFEGRPLSESGNTEGLESIT